MRDTIPPSGPGFDPIVVAPASAVMGSTFTVTLSIDSCGNTPLATDFTLTGNALVASMNGVNGNTATVHFAANEIGHPAPVSKNVTVVLVQGQSGSIQWSRSINQQTTVRPTPIPVTSIV